MTSSLVAYMLKELKSCHSMVSVARRCNVSPFTVARVFNFVSSLKPKLTEVLSIDEFKGNCDEGKYQCILTDPKNHKVLDILPGREMHRLSAYFASFSKTERAKVKAVVIDMWRLYQDAEYLWNQELQSVPGSRILYMMG